MKKSSGAKKTKLSVRLGPAGKGRRMGTEVIGPTGYARRLQKKVDKAVIEGQVKPEDKK
jgi:hypothetical protein